MSKITRVTKGQRPTLLEASKANELIDKINALSNITIESGDQDIVYVNPDGVKIYYKGSDEEHEHTTPPPEPIGTGFFDSIEVINFNGLASSVIKIEDGFVVSAEPRQIQLGQDYTLQLLDPTNPERIINILVRNGFVSEVTTSESNFTWTDVQVCVNGSITNKKFLTDTGGVPNEQDLGSGDLLNNFYTKQEAESLFALKSEIYTREESDSVFLNNESPDMTQEFNSAFLQAIR